MKDSTLHRPNAGEADPSLDRRGFLRFSLAGAALAATHRLRAQDKPAAPPPAAPVTTNIQEILKLPRTATSMPGRHPGRVVRMTVPSLSQPEAEEAVFKAVHQMLMALTKEKTLKAAWRALVSPKDVVGLKLNPIGGKLLSNNPLVVKAVLRGLQEAGLPKANLLLWDRRRGQLLEAGFTPEAFPGIAIEGTENEGPNGKMVDDQGRLWSLDRIDLQAPCYEVSLEGKYDAQTLPYMVNEGTKTYFAKLATQRCTKIINLPVLKNAGPSVTLCLKNLAYGATTNTARLHKIWHRSIAEMAAFPCLRDKVVLNLVDGTRACYEGGPGANAAYIWSPNLLLMGTDPVAVDALGYEFVLAERLSRGIQKADTPKGREFLVLAETFGLGVAQRDKIEVLDLKG